MRKTIAILAASAIVSFASKNNVEMPKEYKLDNNTNIFSKQLLKINLYEEEAETVAPYYFSYKIPKYPGFKSYMGYKAITSPTSAQYKLQYQYAYTGNYGIRMVNERYCVALGSHFNTSIGQYFDLVLENGTIIPCIMGDLKDNKHTDNNNIFTIANNCCSEFIVDMNNFNTLAKKMGDTSYVCNEWESPVVEIRVYDENAFN